MSQNSFALAVFNTNVPKSSVFKSLEHFCTQLVVAEEECIYKYTNTGSKVHRIYMCTIVCLFGDQIEQIINSVYKTHSLCQQESDVNDLNHEQQQKQRRQQQRQQRFQQHEDIVLFEHCSDKHEYIRDITLYDLRSIRKNVQPHELSIGTQTYDWLMGTSKQLHSTDTFLIQHEQMRDYLTELHAHYWHKQHASNMENLQKLFLTCLKIKN